MIRITIDTCLINVKRKLVAVNKLEEFDNQKKIQLVATDRLIMETENHSDRLKKAESYESIAEPFTIGYSRIGRAYISDGLKRPSFHDIAAILFPDIKVKDLTENQSNDVMHLMAHIHSDSEYFVTNNTKDFIDSKKTNQNRDGGYKNFKRNQLKDMGIIVYTPDDILMVLETEHDIR